MMRTLIILCTVLASVTALPENFDLDMVFVVDDSSRLREFKLPEGDPLLFKLMLSFFVDIWNKLHCQVGLVTYGDKPQLPWMAPVKTINNYCSKRRLRLQPTYSDFFDQMQGLGYVTQASDNEEMTDAHAGLMEAMNPNMGWRRPTNERPVLRLIVLAAGAHPRQQGAGLHHFWRPFKYETNKGDFNYNCNRMDYYSTNQVLATMQKLNVLPYIFSWWGFSGPYKEMIGALGRGKFETFRANVPEVLRVFYSENPRRLTTITDEDELLA